jgi:hypothetical protein
MKYSKTLAIAALAAAALVALAAAGTASATVLCKNNLNTAKCGEPFPLHTLFEAQIVGQATIWTELNFEAKCNKAAIGAKTENEGSGTETVRLPDAANKETLVITFAECSCTVAVLKTGSLEIHFIPTTDNGTVTSSGLELTTTCTNIFGTAHCIYKTSSTDIGTLEGGKPAKLKISAPLTRVTTSAICEPVGAWEGEYEVTTPKPLYVAAA